MLRTYFCVDMEGNWRSNLQPESAQASPEHAQGRENRVGRGSTSQSRPLSTQEMHTEPVRSACRTPNTSQQQTLGRSREEERRARASTPRREILKQRPRSQGLTTPISHMYHPIDGEQQHQAL